MLLCCCSQKTWLGVFLTFWLLLLQSYYIPVALLLLNITEMGVVFLLVNHRIRISGNVLTDQQNIAAAGLTGKFPDH